MYVDAAFVTDRLSVGLSCRIVSPAKTAEPIEMPFGFRTQVGSANRGLDRGPDPLTGRDNFWGKGRPL